MWERCESTEVLRWIWKILRTSGKILATPLSEDSSTNILLGAGPACPQTSQQLGHMQTCYGDSKHLQATTVANSTENPGNRRPGNLTP